MSLIFHDVPLKMSIAAATVSLHDCVSDLKLMTSRPPSVNNVLLSGVNVTAELRRATTVKADDR